MRLFLTLVLAPLMAFQRTVLGRTRRGRLEKGTLGGHRATARRGCRAAVGGRTVAGAGPAPRVGLGSARRGSAARLLHLAALHSCAGQTGVLGCDARKASGAALSPSRRDPGSRRRPANGRGGPRTTSGARRFRLRACTATNHGAAPGRADQWGAPRQAVGGPPTAVTRWAARCATGAFAERRLRR